jgi:hypothetical protein
MRRCVNKKCSCQVRYHGLDGFLGILPELVFAPLLVTCPGAGFGKCVPITGRSKMNYGFHGNLIIIDLVNVGIFIQWSVVVALHVNKPV